MNRLMNRNKLKMIRESCEMIFNFILDIPENVS